MSIYNVLATEIPMIGYSVLHYPNNSTTHKEYVRAILLLHESIKCESEKIQQEWLAYLANVKAKTIQNMRGTLSQFLSTPIQSDTSDIELIIGDQVTHIAEQLLPKISYGITTSSEQMLTFDGVESGMNKWLTAGKKHLRNLEFPPKDVYESFFILEGSSNLDIIEFIIRERIGVQSGAHGKHLSLYGDAQFTVFNLLYSKNDLVRTHEKAELSIAFSKANGTYDEIKTGTMAILSAVVTDAKLSHVSLWQRKLGIGDDLEFRLTLRGKDKALLQETAAYFIKGVKKNQLPVTIEHAFTKDILG
jgi:hypothetical protein